MECSSVLMPSNTSCNLSPLLSTLILSLYLMLALLAIRSTTSQGWVLALSPGFASSIILSLQSPPMVILLSSLLLMLAMSSELFACARLIMQCKWPRHFRMWPTSLSPLKLYIATWKVWSRACSEEETTSSQATSLKGPVGLCREPQGVDSGELDESMVVWWDQN